MLAEKLYNLPSFKRQYEALLILSVSDTIPYLNWHYEKESLLSQIDWNNILGIASVFSYTDYYQYLDAALRIAQTCLSQSTTNESQKNSSAIILEILTNKPAIKLAIERNYLNSEYKSEYPFIFKLQTTKIEIENSILLKDEIIRLNRFQKNVHDIYEQNDTISISAPTSAGKSYILCTILLEELLKNKTNIVYLVPTRALISQVEYDLRELIKQYQISDVEISTVPQNDLNPDKSNVFVFTQERLHWFLIDNPLIELDILIIDEAHKIEDSNRGILLQQKLEEVVQKFPKIKVYFSSPFTSNPEILLENVKNNSKKEKVNTQFVSVNQNLIYATQYPKKRDIWDLSLCLIDKSIYLGHIKLKDRPTTELKKITFISKTFSAGNSGNIIYANGAAEAENASLVLFDLIDASPVSQKLLDLKNLVQKIIHKDYTLAKVLMKGIAFHYGNMPLLIRQEIENLFKKGEIKYLVCTSTLLEGVNLPAKSIFIRRPTRGKNHPLNQNDFWNLAGRAGRWGKEYSGNIVCIEPDDWEIKPNPNKTQQIIKRAIDTIEENGSELIDYIKSKSPRELAYKRQDLEFAFGYYYNIYLNGQLLPSNKFYSELIDEFSIIKTKIVIPDYIVKRNTGISPLAQQTLFDFFSNNLEQIEQLIPVYPEDVKAYEEYAELVGRIGSTISSYPEQLNNPRAILLINWMSGKPLSFIIKKSYESYKKNNSIKSLPIIIREVMDNIETFVRFRFAKDSSCYVDIIRYFLELHGKSELLASIPQLNLWLEFGVSQKTHLSLLSLGLSRNTVIELTNFITNSQMTKDECFNWIRTQNFEQLGLSPIIIDEINRII